MPKFSTPANLEALLKKRGASAEQMIQLSKIRISLEEARGRGYGRKPKHEEWMNEKALEMLTDLHVYYPLRAVAAALGIDSSTLSNWCTDGDHAEFENAVNTGIAFQEMRWANALIWPAQGMNVTGLIFTMKNSVHRWKDRSEVEQNVNLESVLEKQAKAAPKIDWESPVEEATEETKRLGNGGNEGVPSTHPPEPKAD